MSDQAAGPEKKTKPDKKADVWMPLYVGDYLSATGHLSTAEHGAYLILLMTAWQKGGALPNDSERLRRITRMDREEWQSSEPVLREFFYTAEDGLLRNTRIDMELGRATENVKKRSDSGSKAGKASARARAEKKAAQEAEKRKASESAADAERPLNESANESATTVERPLNESANKSVTEHQRFSTPSPSPTTTTDTHVSVAAVTGAQEKLPPLPVASEKTKRIGLVCRLLRSQGVNCNPAQFAGKYEGLESNSDDDFILAVQTLTQRGEKSIGLGLVAAVLGDIAEGRKQPRVMPQSRHTGFDDINYTAGREELSDGSYRL